MSLAMPELTPEAALLFRIIHLRNLPWILANGLHAASSAVQDPGFVSIGNADLIADRATTRVRHEMGGTLAHYVPFYLTPRSPMLLNILSGRNGVERRRPEEIVVLVSSVHRLVECKLPFLITDRHAIYRKAQFSTNLSSLAKLDWDSLRASDFRRDSDEAPERFERYQAEILVKHHVPLDALLGIACATEMCCGDIEHRLHDTGCSLPVRLRKTWYF